MVQKLEALGGGGGSIRVGTTGTISSLMTRELETVKSSPQTPIPCHDKPGTTPVSVSCSVSTLQRLQARKSWHEASGSSVNYRSSETPGILTSSTRSSTILASDCNTSDRIKKKGSNFVEIVDIKCGSPDRAWASPFSNKFKKLGFSKLSNSTV
ncbi:hypothetical protein K2173_010730 [Erythroxylum novogranatense]|uniref:Uncharacterized protein n=1 Tax=Erythroxylum novogranatense TaxID=1862640 RepID=A0AAV8SRK3_9ROSI|nr:hypothetical protein K2173_010730 [Erythroxylum novogranatense]